VGQEGPEVQEVRAGDHEALVVRRDRRPRPRPHKHWLTEPTFPCASLEAS
jgi:hypothetical protein